MAETVYQHHERLDGSSYPQGLHSPEIRLEARILAVVDVLETIASHRPYHPAKRLDAALVEIADHRGSLYDVDVARTALGLAETGALADGVPAHALRHGLS